VYHGAQHPALPADPRHTTVVAAMPCSHAPRPPEQHMCVVRPATACSLPPPARPCCQQPAPASTIPHTTCTSPHARPLQSLGQAQPGNKPLSPQQQALGAQHRLCRIVTMTANHGQQARLAFLAAVSHRGITTGAHTAVSHRGITTGAHRGRVTGGVPVSSGRAQCCLAALAPSTPANAPRATVNSSALTRSRISCRALRA